MNVKCKICGNKSFFHEQALILGKYNIQYFSCPFCGFLQTEEAYWLDEAYSKAITIYDTGIMQRNFTNAVNTVFFLNKTNMKDGKCLDFGGGHGIFTRMMRDFGFDFYHYDKYAENLFAGGFEGNLNAKYDLITSFENFEHFLDPLAEIKNIIRMTDTLYFSTLMIPNTSPPPRIKDWWYYCPPEGQHISFYTRNTLEYVARLLGLYLLSDNHSTHIFSKSKIAPGFFKSLNLFNKINNKVNIIQYYKQESKTQDDFERLFGDQS
jgi:2-polyprenyl-3-methyl-5-hydroxy-6-metoxy-1,4-benzoquinol methylase